MLHLKSGNKQLNGDSLISVDLNSRSIKKARQLICPFKRINRKKKKLKSHFN